MIKVPDNTKFIEDITDIKTSKAIDAMDLSLAKEIANNLLAVYKGYGWVVDVDSRKGGVTLLCGEVQGALSTKFPYKFWIPMEQLSSHKVMVKKVIMAAGEILERANLPRGKWTGERPRQVDGVKKQHQPIKGLIYDV
jgi:hypothetical protein